MRRKAEIERKKGELISELKKHEEITKKLEEEKPKYYEEKSKYYFSLIRDLNNQIKALDWVLELI